jgi:hypothetical protein
VTNETAIEAVTQESGGYLQFGIPGVAYSAVRLPLVEDLLEQDEWIARAINAAQLLANAYHEAFAESPQSAPEAAPRTQPRPAPQPAQPTNGAAQRARVAPGRAPAAVAGTGAYCPEHPNVEVIPSKQQYARYEEDEFGNQVQANFFCPGAENGTGKNHNLWRRQLVWPEPDALPF